MKQMDGWREGGGRGLNGGSERVKGVRHFDLINSEMK